ncbi:XapX domain-containing protein [Cupriavidus necator]|uniref:XapX domain-containing protein n=1 Tax=Cupriavidus necator TaxID=106590 RepID=UPI0009B92AE1|nr:XapX domain-containing protein [Cupriavidus necator]
MKPYIVSLAAGILVGVIYAVINVRSPAPPAIALVGLLGMLVGEQIVAPINRIRAGAPITAAWFRQECVPKISGLPSKSSDQHSVPVIVAETGKEPSARD